jgi:hypothetical protein
MMSFVTKFSHTEMTQNPISFTIGLEIMKPHHLILVSEGFMIPRVHSNIFNLSLISNSFVLKK